MKAVRLAMDKYEEEKLLAARRRKAFSPIHTLADKKAALAEISRRIKLVGPVPGKVFVSSQEFDNIYDALVKTDFSRLEPQNMEIYNFTEGFQRFFGMKLKDGVELPFHPMGYSSAVSEKFKQSEKGCLISAEKWATRNYEFDFLSEHAKLLFTKHAYLMPK